MLLCLVMHLFLVKYNLVAAGANFVFLRNIKLKMDIAIPAKAHPKTVVQLLFDIGWPHLNGAVARVVVVVKQDLYDIHTNAGCRGMINMSIL